jgi:hypothetical protein
MIVFCRHDKLQLSAVFIKIPNEPTGKENGVKLGVTCAQCGVAFKFHAPDIRPESGFPHVGIVRSGTERYYSH